MSTLPESASPEPASPPLRVFQVVPRIADGSSGPSVSVPSLSAAVQAAGVETMLYALEPPPVRLAHKPCQFFPCVKFPFAHRLGVSPALKRSLQRAALDADVIHTHSLWMFPNIYPLEAIRGTSCSLVVSPRGTLSPWALGRARLRKRVIWQLGQRATIEHAACLHATSVEELQQIRDQGFRNPVAVIPNGVFCPPLPTAVTRLDERRTLLYLGRIHPTKGLEFLMDAWKRLQHGFPNWTLKIAGPMDHPYARQLVQSAETMRLKRIAFVGEMKGEKKAQVFQSSDLYVLPSHSENFGMSVAEALAHGLPAVVFQGAPWSGLDEHGAGRWISPNVDALVSTLSELMSLPDADRVAMGVRGHDWMRTEYDWAEIGKRMVRVYRWIKGIDEKPSDVIES